MAFLRLVPAFLILMPILAGAPVRAAAEETSESTVRLPLAAELSGMLGWTPEEAYAWLGAPEALFPFTDESGDDCVVLYFPDHSYLFWYDDRVWQVRVDQRWEGTVDGVSMGAMRDEVEDLWGPPINDFDDNPTWTLPDRGYPVRVRLYFDEADRLADLYVYRSDW